MEIARIWLGRLVVCLLAALLAGCSLPPLDGRTHSRAISTDQSYQTALGRVLAPEIDAHPGQSGIYSLADPHEAYAARVLLTRAAEKTLDVQSYIWRNDVSGMLLMGELREAAARGVRVRLLLDDNGTAGLDEALAVLHRLPNIEVRLFNPFVVRTPKIVGYLTDFQRVNRRMHNKSYTADGLTTIIGGRNVGDEYFGAGSTLFADLDVLAVGPVAHDVSQDFDLYWESGSSYPADLILPEADEAAASSFRADREAAATSAAAQRYEQAVARSQRLAALLDGTAAFEWAKTTMVSDDPAKGLGEASHGSMLVSQMGKMLGSPARSVELVSPYFVPTAAGVEAFGGMVQGGVRVRVLTNSLAATDVAVVHAGYVKRRKDLLRAGIELYEMRPTPPEQGGRRRGSAPFGSSGSSLHAKTFAVDGKRVFVGSFNFDPRSARLNTELGFIIESPHMARQIADAFDHDIAKTSYEVLLSDSGSVYWIERRDGRVIRHDTEPEVGVFKREFVQFLSTLPIEWML